MAKFNSSETKTRAKSHVKNDKFFKRPKTNFKQPFRSFKKRGNDSGESLKPSCSSNSDDFFVKKADSVVVSSGASENKSLHRQQRNDGRFFKKQTSNKNTDNKFASQKTEEGKEKKPFDKKKWRLQKYSKKYKLQQWEDKHKKTVLREYYKQTKHDQPSVDVKKIYEEEENENHSDSGNDQEAATGSTKDVNVKQPGKKRSFLSVRDRFLQAKEEKEERRVAAEKKKAEREAALKEYRKKKLEKYKKLSQRTRKGQPIMKHRIDMLLEQIQQIVD